MMSGCRAVSILLRSGRQQQQQRQQQPLLLLLSSSQSSVRLFSSRVVKESPRCISTGQSASYSSKSSAGSSGDIDMELPDSIRRVNETIMFPNEYPGQNYAFNWCLNGDGVTPLRRSSFRITKPLDLKVAGLTPSKVAPLKVTAAPESKMPEAGSDELSFETFDEVSQRTRDLLSLSDHLYCPEGHVPGTRTGVRFITNSAKLAPELLAYVERAPRKEPPQSLPITVYILEQEGDESFAGYAIEEIEVPIPDKEEKEWMTVYDPVPDYEAKSVASVVVVGPKPDLSVIATGLELSHKALAADELERQKQAGE